MLPRSQRSIFHLGEEGGDELLGADGHGVDSTISIHHHQRLVGRGRDADGGAVVGLQIVLAQKHQQQHRDARPCRIVLKQMVWPPAPVTRRPCSFLRACSLCRRELSPDKDVYMYRGDQGFCSEECRWHQILTDEAREQEAVVKKERRGLHHRHYHGPTRPTAAIRGGSPRRLLAVA
ncbi:hypothetical protein E2562_008223 [Oryza meyeriana var. granulata]|uniref:FLZ-type domain-containing protein n=1 Tax=Oryza meyeriana var. granulata TaxID=110450 RepID=A0A6G1DGL8_9ORYZ|nr:hypothetical protein E2562_008223 [Oryza meyeriana var. granulata]